MRVIDKYGNEVRDTADAIDPIFQTQKQIVSAPVSQLATANNTAYTSTYPLVSLVTGAGFRGIMPAANSTGTVTLNVNGLGAKPVLNASDMTTNVGSGLLAYGVYDFAYCVEIGSGIWIASGLNPASTSYPVTIDTADGTIPAKRLVEIDGSGDLVVATYNSYSVYGYNATGAQKTIGQAINLYLNGPMTCVADLAIPAGRPVKAAHLGKVMRLVTPEIAASALKTNATAGNFGNQPANDYIEVASNDAGDTTQTVDVYGTTNGTDTVVKETFTLAGVAQQKSTKADWGEILAVVVSGAHAGTVTVREFSASQTIITLATGTLSAGYIAVAESKCFNSIPYLVPGGAVTTKVGILGTAPDGTALMDAQAQVASTTNQFNSIFRTVTYVLTGDVQTGTTPSVQVGPADDISLMVGKNGYAAADTADAVITR